MQNKRPPFSRYLLLTAGMFVVLAIGFFVYVGSEKQIDRANELRLQSYLLADELRQSSDDLTRMARTYVLTGDRRYKAYYQTILDIREGRVARPVGYQNIYWDLALANGPEPRSGNGQGVALLELMRQAGFADDEFRKLADAKDNSDALTATELTAMQLLETTGAKAGDDRAMARAMLHDDKYHQAKAGIMQPLSDFYQMMEARTTDAVHAAERKALFLRTLFGLTIVTLLFMLLRINRALRATLGGSVDAVHAHIARIGRGDFSSPITGADGKSNSVLGLLARTQANLSRIDRERRQAEDALVAREALLKQILDTSSVAIFLVDMQGRITQANQRMAEMFCCTTEDLVGSEYVGLVHPSEREVGRQKMLALLASATPSVDLDRLYWRADHSQFWGHLTGRRFHDVSGEELGLIGVIADVNVRKLAEEALKESEFRWKFAIEGSGDGVWDWNIQTDEAKYSRRWKEMLGYTDDDILPTNQEWVTRIHPDDGAYVAETMQAYLEGKAAVYVVEYRLRCKDDSYKWILGRGMVVSYSDDGKPLRMIGTHTDITERKHAEEELYLAASVFTYAREGIMITTADGKIIDVNNAFTRITGYSRDEVLGRNPRLLSSGRQDPEFYAAMWRDLVEKGHWYGEIWNRRKNGEIYAEMQTISVVRDAKGLPKQYVALFSDITALKEHERQLEHIAHYDVLTTLPNRVLLADRLRQGMAQAMRRKQPLAVAYLDLDGFKAVNDQHGHEVGDRLLMTVATRMKQATREGDTLARLGGDEFVAVLLDLSDVAASVLMLNRLLTAAAMPVHVDDLELQVSASVGVTFFPQTDEVDADQLLRQADQAMYQAKLAGKNRYHVFDTQQDSNARGHHESLEHIRRALVAREFVLHYQPKVNMRTGVVIGAEALIRWQHPEKGLLPPAMFLPVIEDHPLSIEIGEWVIDAALVQMTQWHAAGLDIPVSVNVGARQLLHPDFPLRLREILALHPTIRPGELELEVLETSALEDLAQASEVIDACRLIGVMFALDDFGTGYSSLTYLKRLSVAQLKIDQSFVRDMLDDPDDLAILEGVLGLAVAFRRQVIAEGVETVEHGEMLLQLGCELAQGYGIARPMPGADLPGWATVWRPDVRWLDCPAVDRDDLPLLFASVEHRAWVGALESYLKNERSDPPPLDQHHCRFGCWLDAEGGLRHGTQPAFQFIEQTHQQVHALAVELCDLHIRGAKPEALARLGELHGLRDALLQKLKALLQGSRP